MARKLSDVERDAMELPPRERAVLAERLLATLEDGDDGDVEGLWLQEAEKRYADYRAGKITQS
ncbi:MAG: addiction module antitoxin RelB [Dehalococcoidia bacterium]|nr:addiction module antitoxin RelB [Dehalococcoidia bacterium]MSQ16019.1 addiction module antitoxin RelB [Dehalococcoidia bacterium]